MARVKAEMKCPYCDEIKAVSGMTSHVRHKHTEHYEEFKKNRLALVEKYKIVEGKPVPNPAPEPVPEPDPAPNPDPTPDPDPEPTPKPDPKDQPSGSFLGSIAKSLREW